MSKFALYLNGVFEEVLEEILNSQDRNGEDEIFFLQPYSSKVIKKLKEHFEKRDSSIPFYASTTKRLNSISFMGDIVLWEDKRKLSDNRLRYVNGKILKNQPNEQLVYFEVDENKIAVNILSVKNVQRISNEISTQNLIKIDNEEPLKKRTRPGNWSYVIPLPNWVNLEKSYLKENVHNEFEKDLAISSKRSIEERLSRIEKSDKIPEKIIMVTTAYKRNSDVVTIVLERADGKCERCKKDAPFTRAKDNTPYLEVHHIKMLSLGGEDSVENAIAVCPNCHREMHFGLK